jgi:putative transposase
MKYLDPVTGKTSFRELRRDSSETDVAFELTFSCYRQFQFLDRDRTREWFVESLQEARNTLPFDLWAWVIMPEHVHLLVCPRSDEMTVGEIRSRIKEPVARRAIAWLEQSAPDWLPRITVQEGKRTRRRFWQPGGGYDRNATELVTIYSMIDYIHNNPVRRGLVEKSTDWEWSSARWYADMSPVLIQMDRTLPMRVE